MDFFHRLIKTKSKRLKLLRFEIVFWFRLQVKNKGGGALMSNKPNQLGPLEWVQCLRLAHSRGPNWLGLLPLNHPSLLFTWGRNQNQISKRSNFNLVDFVFIRRWKKSTKSIILNLLLTFFLRHLWQFELRLAAIMYSSVASYAITLYDVVTARADYIA
jgi:hypothetical protein